MTTPDEEIPPVSGLVAGKYQLVRMIGRGGMGSVWEARNATIGTRVAIKFIEAEYAESDEARGRFIREARAAATIESRHLIRIFDHGHTEDGKPFIVMELLQGEPLDKRLERLGTLSLQDTAQILMQVCRGLTRAHEAGIVHRDLKPENIFLTHSLDDDHEIAKVLDFGIAKIQPQNGGPSASVGSATKTGAVLGTPFYMSPEQARGLRNVDHRTDLWSLGVIAFRCVIGRLPFDGESVGDLLVKICTAPPPIPSQLDPRLPPAFDMWFQHALEREPDQRYQNGHDLAADLARAAGIAPPGSGASFGGTPIASLPAVSGAVPAQLGAAHRASMGSDPTAFTPAPGGMTGSPFTAPVAGVPAAGRGKVIALAAVLGLALAGGLTGLYVVSHRTPHAVGIAPPPATSSAEPVVSAEPAVSAEPLPTETTPVTTAATDVKPGDGKPSATSTKTGTKVTTKVPVTTKPVTTKPVASAAASATAKEAASAAPTPTKKPTPLPTPATTRTKDDPGY